MKRYKEQNSEKISAYLAEIKDIPKDRIVYLDETGMDSYLYREYCYSPKGQSIVGTVSGKKYHRVGIVAAQMGKQVFAPLQYDGTMDSKLFEVWFETRLLRELPSNSVIVMDNAAFHRKKQLICIAEKHGHRVVFLPPYSPDLNPIEKFWAWLKHKMKNALSHFKTLQDALHYCFMLK